MSSDVNRGRDNNQKRSLVRAERTGGNYSFRATMVTARLVFLGLALLAADSVSSESYFVKCCPPGRLYSGSSKVDCLSAPSYAMELHVLHSNATAEPQGHPVCDEPEDLVTTALNNFVPGEYLEVPACLEILHDEKSGESAPIVVHCRSSKDRQGVKATNASLPQIMHVRKCCPRDTTFDRSTRTCVSQPNNASSLLTFLPNVPADEDHHLVIVTTNGPPKCKGPTVDYEISEDDVFLRNGTYSVMIPTFENGSVVKEEYFATKKNVCLDTTPYSASNRKLIARVCRDREYCDRNACVRKCCIENEFFYAPKCGKRVTSEAPPGFHPIFTNAMNVTQSSAFNATSDYGLLIGTPCRYGFFPVNPINEKCSLTSQGYVKLESYTTYDLDNYCIDSYYINETHYNKGFRVFICFDGPVEDKKGIPTSYKVNTALELTSCIFLLMTLLVYACLPSLQNLHGKTLMCHVGSLLLAFVCLAVIPWITHLDTNVPCKVLGYTMLFFFLSAFSWLNVMCFDIWWTFGGLRGDTVMRGRKHRRRFLLYCLYAWGFSFLVSILTIISDFTDILPVSVRPNVGYTSCWFTQYPVNSYGEMTFFIGPVTIQLISNVVFFVLTSIHCNQVKAEVKRVTKDPMDPRSKRFHSDRNRLIMNIKLFVVMGMSWVCEVMSFFLKRYHVEWQDAIFYVSDVFNCLQGLLIFILFVLKIRVYVALRRRLGLDVGKKRDCNTTTLHDPYRVRKTASNSTLMSTFVVSSAP